MERTAPQILDQRSNWIIRRMEWSYTATNDGHCNRVIGRVRVSLAAAPYSFPADRFIAAVNEAAIDEGDIGLRRW